jgi:hypothetical protein
MQVQVLVAWAAGSWACLQLLAGVWLMYCTWRNNGESGTGAKAWV